MAISASQLYQQTLDDIIRRALRMVGASHQLQPEEWSNARLAFQAISNNLVARGNPLWRISSLSSLLPDISYVAYDSNYYKCIKSHTSDNLLNIPGSEESAFIWKADVVRAETEDWEAGVNYTSPRALEMASDTAAIVDVYIKSGDETSRVKLVDRDTFKSLNREDIGLPSKAYFEPVFLQQGITGYLHLYPEADDNYQIFIDTITTPDMGTDTSSIPNIPPQWQEVLTIGLAADLSYEYGIAPDAIVLLERKAKDAYETAKRGNFNNSHDGLIVKSRNQ